MAIRAPSLGDAAIIPVGGPAGTPGLSSYQLWLAAGNAGTLADFLATLRGANGQSAYEAWLALGYVGSLADFIASLKGDSGSGSGGTITGVAAAATSGHRVLYPRADGSGLAVASASDATQAGRVVGISVAAALAGQSITYVDDGPIDEPSWSFQPGPVWLGEGGQITQAPPPAGFAQVVGTAVTPTRIVVSLQIPIILA